MNYIVERNSFDNIVIFGPVLHKSVFVLQLIITKLWQQIDRKHTTLVSSFYFIIINVNFCRAANCRTNGYWKLQCRNNAGR